MTAESAERRRAAPPARAAEAGQASVEAIAVIPAFILAGLVALQLLATGYTVALADGAAEAAALALASDGSPEDAARAALPGWARDDIEVAVDGGRVEVAVRPPSPLGAVAEELEVSSSSVVRPAR